MSYVKIERGFLSSMVWLEPSETRLVWVLLDVKCCSRREYMREKKRVEAKGATNVR